MLNQVVSGVPACINSVIGALVSILTVIQTVCLYPSTMLRECEMANKELQEAINETFQQTKTHTGVEKHKAEEHLKKLRRVQLERAKEGLYE